jgi:hypothetical protein
VRTTRRRRSPRTGRNAGVRYESPDMTNDVAEAVNRLVDEYRGRCLWFLRGDYYPATDDERLAVLAYIERYGDRNAYARAAEVRQWLSRASSATSAGC